MLLLDEPLNGFDPEGIRWLRRLLRDIAAQGRTVFVSSHLMSEMEETADRLVIIRADRLIECVEMSELPGRFAGLHVRTADAAVAPVLADVLRRAGAVRRSCACAAATSDPSPPHPRGHPS